MSTAGSNFSEDEPPAAAIGHGRGIRHQAPLPSSEAHPWIADIDDPTMAQAREFRAVSPAQAAW